MNKLTHKINGKDYLLMDMFMTIDKKNKEKEIEVKKIGCIVRGIKEINSGGLFNKDYIIVEVLVPFDKIKQFDKITN